MQRENPIIGFWWDPADSEHKLPGVLSFDETGIQLLIFGHIDEHTNGRLQILHGRANRQLWTLVHTQERSFSSPLRNPLSEQQIWSAQYLVQGLLLDDASEKFPQLRFQMQSLQTWSQLTGLKKEWSMSAGLPEPSYTFERNPVTPIEFYSPEFRISLEGTFAYPPGQWGVFFREDTAFTLQSDSGLSLDQWFNDGIIPLRRLVSLSTRMMGDVYGIVIFTDAFDENRLSKRPAWGRVFGQGILSVVPSEAESVKPSIRPLFLATQLNEVTQGNLAPWFDLHSRYRSVGDYVDTFADGTDNIRRSDFFSAARLLESVVDTQSDNAMVTKELFYQIKQSVHDALPEDLHSDVRQFIDSRLGRLRESPNANRFLEIFESFRDVLCQLKLEPYLSNEVASLMANTRNCEAHHSPNACRNAASGNDLMGIAALIELLADMALMRAMCFSDDFLVSSREHDRRPDFVKQFLSTST